AESIVLTSSTWGMLSTMSGTRFTSTALTLQPKEMGSWRKKFSRYSDPTKQHPRNEYTARFATIRIFAVAAARSRAPSSADWRGDTDLCSAVAARLFYRRSLT